MKTDLASQMARIRPGDHLCMIYGNLEEQMAAAVPFIRDGLARREVCLYVADDLSVERVAEELERGGVEVRGETSRGALILMTKRDAYLKSGEFDPVAMIAMLEAAVERALAAGFSGFRVTGEMTWALGSECGCERLLEYEVRLNRFFPGSKAAAICQYNRNRFPASTIRDVLKAHPVAIVGNQVCTNHYYEPPSISLGAGSDEERVGWMLDQLKAVHAREVRLERLNDGLERQKRILEALAVHAPLEGVLRDIAAFTESEAPGRACGFHLVARDGKALAPGFDLPLGLDGEVIPIEPPYRHPGAMAAHTARPVLVESPADDARWPEAWRRRARELDIRSFWSLPIIAPDGDILGTLDLSATRPHSELPRPPAVETATHLAGIAIRQRRDGEALRASEEQLRQSHKMDAIGRLAGGVAHDFNNMLTAINGYSEILHAALADGAPEKSHVEEIRKAGQKAAALTHQLLAFGRKQRLSPAVLDLNEDVNGMVRMLERILGENIAIRTDLDPDLGRIKADPTQVGQVVLNLAVNAKDAMPDGGTLTLETRNVEVATPPAPGLPPSLKPGSYVRLTVRDTGVGMDREVMAQIFEPFFTTKDKTRNSGLGLAMVYGVVSQSGGVLSVASEPGRGSVFRIWFPRVDAAAAPVRREEAPAARAGRLDARPGQGKTVLVAEDEDMVRRLVVGLLKAEGYRVLQASHGGEALEAARAHDGAIHLLLTDVIMPGMNGRELAGTLTAERPETAVLFMSGYTGETILRHGIKDNAAGFIGKPFSPADLIRKVHDLLGARVEAA